MPVPLTRPARRRDLETLLLEDLTRNPPLRGPAALEHATRFAALLGDPQDEARQVHVVGTAGKGTIAAALTDLIVAGGRTVGTHMSPHVYDLRERFLVGGELVEWPEVLEAATDVFDAAVQLRHDTGRPPSFFAATAALSWVLGRRAGVEIHVTEAGIGGRHDATNVIRAADKITVITSIGIDHADVLGPDLIEIAQDKAAVIAPGGVAVVGPQPRTDALDAVAEVVADRGARLVVVDQAITDWRAAAAAVAAAVVDELGMAAPPGAGVSLPPGRLETWTLDGRLVVVDGAHNPIKLEALRETLAGGAGPDPAALTVVVAVGAGKDLDACAEAISRLAARAVVAEFGDPGREDRTPRSWPAEAVARALAAHGVDVVARASSPAEAADRARDAAGPTGPLLVTGSFLHLAGVRDRLMAGAEEIGRGPDQSTPR